MCVTAYVVKVSRLKRMITNAYLCIPDSKLHAQLFVVKHFTDTEWIINA